MATVRVTLDSQIGAAWMGAFERAITNLNALFRRERAAIVLSQTSEGPVISVRVDSSIGTTAVHGQATTETTTAGRLVRSEVRLPVQIEINTPRGMRGAGPGVYEVVAAHELVHSLGHAGHNSHLMAQTFQKVMGDTPAGDRLQANTVILPPLRLSDDSVSLLRGIWG